MIRPPTATERRPASAVVALVALVALGMIAPRPARADEPSIAEQLFVEGRELMQQKRYAEACVKFKASHDRDPSATGTLLNLALCHEATAKPATAWAEFRQVAAESAGRREDRVEMARDHERKLYATLPHLVIDVPPAARVPELAVALDGEDVPPAAWGMELPVDPGVHQVRAAAPGKVTATLDVRVGADADRRSLVVAPLADAAPAVDPAVEAERRAVARSRRTLGFVVGGAGVVLTAGGVFVGAAAAKKNHDATSACPNDLCADVGTRDAARDDLSTAKTLAVVSDVTVAVGLVALVAGAYFVFTAPPRRDGRAAWIAPLIDTRASGALVGGAF